MVASISRTTTSANLAAPQRVGVGKFLELVLNAGAAAQPGRVEHLQGPAAPFEIDADRVASEAGLGADQQPLLAEDVVQQRRLAGVGAPDDGDRQRLGQVELAAVLLVVEGLGRAGLGLLDLGGLLRQAFEQGGIEIREALAVLGRERHRVAQAELVGFHRALAAGLALGLVGDEDERLARRAGRARQRPGRPASGRCARR